MRNNQPLIAIDVVPFIFNGETLQIVVSKRQYEPYKNEQALPGVLLLNNETLEEAAHRALETKTGFNKTETLTLKQVGAYDNSDRDPRGPTISVLFYSIAKNLPDDKNVTAVSSVNTPDLPFDHNKLIESATARLTETVFADKQTLQSLLGRKFTTSEVKNLTTELSINLDQTNLARFLRNIPFIKETNITASPKNKKGRPSKVWEIV